jgi:hypothetical protein
MDPLLKETIQTKYEIYQTISLHPLAAAFSILLAIYFSVHPVINICFQFTFICAVHPSNINVDNYSTFLLILQIGVSCAELMLSS